VTTSNNGPHEEVTESRMTLAEWVRDYNACTCAELSPTLCRVYHQTFPTHVLPILGDLPLADASPEDIARLVQSGTMPPRVAFMVWTALRRSFDLAVRQGIISQNPCTPANKPLAAAVKSPAQALDIAQVQRLIAAAGDTTFASFLTLAVTTGMRLSELLGVRVRDLNLARSEVIASNDKYGGHGRIVAIAPTAAQAVERTLSRTQIHRTECGDALDGEAFLFESRLGQQWHRTSVLHQFRTMVQDAQIPATSFHSLRTTCGTALLAHLGVSPDVVAAQLGYLRGNCAVARRRRALIPLQHEAVRMLDEMLFGTNN
jgi:integrase